jgi:ribosomal RNA-processing protein 12
VKKGRFHVLLKMTAQLPEDALHWVPLFLPEAVLGTKEINQQARLTAFELLLAFARRMSSGSGVIHAKKTRGMLAADVKASLSEFMTMLLAGLAGSTPHMISATMMAIARILFELRTAIDAELLDVLLGDVIAMLHSPSREVVKSSLGFLKVALAALRPNDANNSVDLMERHLETLVPGLLNWANEHHQQFKVRVRHLMERLVRRFGFERVWALTPIDHRKLLTNIRKRRERAKRHKEQTADAADETEGVDYQSEDEMAALTTTALSKATTLTRNTSSSKVTKPSSGFEDALNNSESDLGNSDDDYDIPADSILHDLQGLEGDEEIEKVLSRKLSLAASINNKAPAKNKKVAGLKRLVESDDEGVRVAEDGKLMISDDEDEGTVLDSDEEEGQGSAKKKATTLTIKRAKKQRGDAKRRGDKFEPFTYLPMMRASKESTGEGRTKDKKASKYYMKRS